MRFKRKIKEEMRVLERKRRKNIKKKEEGRKAGKKKGRDGRKERKEKRKATGREEEKQNPESQNSHRIETLNDHTESSFKSVCYADPGHERKTLLCILVPGNSGSRSLLETEMPLG